MAENAPQDVSAGQDTITQNGISGPPPQDSMPDPMMLLQAIQNGDIDPRTIPPEILAQLQQMQGVAG